MLTVDHLFTPRGQTTVAIDPESGRKLFVAVLKFSAVGLTALASLVTGFGLLHEGQAPLAVSAAFVGVGSVASAYMAVKFCKGLVGLGKTVASAHKPDSASHTVKL